VADQQDDLENRVTQLDYSLERLTYEVASLKLEVATLVSALKETHAHMPRRASPKRAGPEPPIRPSMTPAAVVVLLATALLSWQLLATPHTSRAPADTFNPSAAPAVPLGDIGAPAAIPVQIASRTDTRLQPDLPHSLPHDLATAHPTIYKGTLSVNADRPGARVFVNRKSVGTAPVRLRNLRAGAHLVWVERDGFRRWTKVVTVPAERITRVSADLQPVRDTER
jgi:hypothetical protein